MNTFKRLSILSMLLLVLIALTGCGGGQGETASGDATEDQKITIRMAHTEAEDRSINLACLEFEKWIEAESNGNIQVEVFPNGSISSSDADLAESAATGSIEISVSATSALTNYSDKFGILDMPFLFNNAQCAFNAVDGEFGETLNANLEGTGLKILGYSFNGVRNTSNSVRPINQPSDFNGIKMRTMQSPTHIDTFKAFGANATPMSFGEVYTGLQQGTVEGQDNAASLTYAQQFYEVQKYFSLTEHNYGFMALIGNENWYNSLSEANKALVDQGIKECMLDYERELELTNNDNFIKKLEEKGMLVNSITPENHEKFVEIVQPLFDKYAESFGQDLFDLAQSFNK